jgi:CheY-like chemotaxis protein
MVEQAGASPSEAETSLADSRAQFVASLGRRLEALRQALFALEQAPRSAALRDHLRRRIHAFGAAAGVLGFDRVFEAFREAEGVLGRTSAMTLGPAELGLVARTVDLVPSLVLGAAAPVARNRETGGQSGVERRGGGWPISVLVFGAAPLAEPLDRGAPGGDAALECERAEEIERAEAIVRITAPDVAVIDADRKGARELMETLVYDPLLDPVRIIAVGTFDRPEAAASLVALGVARVLPKPVSPDALRRSVQEVARERSAPAERIDPIGDVTIEALGERIAQEVRRGLVDAVKAQGRAASVALGPGTDVLAAVWSAVARIRELVTLRSGGIVRFDASGPEGAVPLAPWMGDDRSRSSGSSESRSADGVSLEGRMVIVVDDDPAVVWFIAGLLRAGGAEVIEAHDGAFALDIARKCWPDVIVSDILMPGLDGFALCREIKRDVALSDVPVILLSWKEDLLQRVRELGADAEGYLRKEATASTVVQRVREVLLPRARIEARLSDGEAARGRLDGLTPRLILQLVCKKSVNARVSIRDAAYLYEVDVRGGRVRSATRTSSDGRFDRGDRALSALLGVRAGRFTVTRDDSPAIQVWDAELDELIAAHVERARAAQRALTDPSRVAQVEIEEGVLEPYLLANPLSAAAIVRRLAEGVPPGDIVATGASPRLLESVLVDLVLHGAITSILGFGGEDLLAAELSSLRQRGDSVEVPAAKNFRTPGPPGAELAQRRAPLPSTDVAREKVATPPMKGGDEDASGFDDWEIGPPAPSAAASVDKPGGPDELFALLTDSIVPAAPVEERPESMRLSMKGLAPPTSMPAEPSPLEMALRSLPTSVSQQFRAVASEEPARVVISEVEESAVFSAPPVASDSPVTLPARPERSGEAPAGEPERPAAGAVPVVSAIGTTTAVSAVMAAPSPDDARADVSAVAGVEPDAEPAAAPATQASVVPPGAEPEPMAASEPQPAEPSAAPAAPTAREARRRSDPVGEIVDEIVAAEEASDAANAANQAAPSVSGADQKRESSAAVELGDAVASAIGVSERGTGAPLSRGSARTTPPISDKRGAPARGRVRRTLASKTPAVPPRGGSKDLGGNLGIAAVMLIAAVATYAVVTGVRSMLADQPKPAESAAVAPTSPPAADLPAPATSVAPVPSAPAVPTLRSDDLELPAGLTVSENRGLLEVEVDQATSVYVDGVFIGKGPVRQVPLREGAHEIHVQGDSVDLVQPIEVRRGRRSRVELTRAP